jgi:hypothetical protein
MYRHESKQQRADGGDCQLIYTRPYGDLNVRECIWKRLGIGARRALVPATDVYIGALRMALEANRQE